MSVEYINLIKPACDARSRPVQLDTMSADMAIKVLETSLGKVVLIKLKGGKVIRGSLQGFDQHMNLSLEKAEEIVADGKSDLSGDADSEGGQHHHDLSSAWLSSVAPPSPKVELFYEGGRALAPTMSLSGLAAPTPARSPPWPSSAPGPWATG